MLEPPVISSVATAQLVKWEAIARDWAAYPDGPCQRCASCHVAIWRIADDTGNDYRYSPEQLLALTVAHLRQAHMDLDPDHE